jgi:RHS repeat-associated protein
MEYTGSGSLKTKYTYGLERLYTENAAASGARGQTMPAAYIPTGTGSVSELRTLSPGASGASGASGQRLLSYAYGPFGETSASAYKRNGAPAAYEIEESYYAYNAEQYGPMTGLQYLRARYYDPGIGRFGSADTYMGRIADPITRNAYIYAGNDPVNYFDPSGHFSLKKMVSSIGNFVKNAVVSAVKSVFSPSPPPKRPTPPAQTRTNSRTPTPVSKKTSTTATGKKGTGGSKGGTSAFDEVAYYAEAISYLKGTQSYNSAWTKRLSARVNRKYCSPTAARVQSGGGSTNSEMLSLIMGSDALSWIPGMGIAGTILKSGLNAANNTGSSTYRPAGNQFGTYDSPRKSQEAAERDAAIYERMNPKPWLSIGQTVTYTDYAAYERALTIWEDGRRNAYDNQNTSIPINPVKDPSVTSEYGYRTHPITGEIDKWHNGIDLDGDVGTPLYAAMDGKIILSTKDGGD